VIPTSDPKHQVSVGYLLLVNYFASFAFDTISTIAASFNNGTLIDLVNAGQNKIKLMICSTVTKPTVGIFAEMNFFQDISIVEIVDFGGSFW
jgi:hypothetical protein